MSHDLYKKRTKINAPVQTVFAWHSIDGAISRLTPPWTPLKLISRSGSGIQKGVRVIFKRHSPTVICIHWLTVVVLAPLGVFYGWFAICAVIGYSFITMTLFFSSNKRKFSDEYARES